MKSFYERYWKGKNIRINAFDNIPHWTEENYLYHIKFFEECLEGVVLDYGVGEGYFLDKIKHSCKEVYGMDISSLALNKARKSYPYLNLTLSENSVYFSKNFFDTIICFDTLEHILDIETTLEEFYRLLKPNGYLCITTSELTILKLFMIMFYGISKYFYPTTPHIRYFTKDSLQDILERKGFEVIKYQPNRKYFGIIPQGQMVIARKI